MVYKPVGWVEGVTALGPVNLNRMETQYDEAMKDLLAIHAEQNVAIWQLQAELLAAREGMTGWQGEGFFNGQNEVASNDASIKIVRGNQRGEGYARAFVVPGFSADAVEVPGVTAGANRHVLWTPTGDQLLIGRSAIPSTIEVLLWNEDTKTFTPGPAFPNQAIAGSNLRGLAIGQAPDGTQWLAQFCDNSSAGRNVWIYKRVPGSDTWEFVVRPSVGVSNNVYDLGDWSDDCTYLACPHSNFSTATGGLFLLKRTGDAFSLVNLPSAPTAIYCFHAVFRGNYLFSAWDGTSNNFLAWKFDEEGNYTKLTTPSIGVTSRVDNVCPNSDGTVLLMTGYNNHLTPFVVQRAGDAFSVVTGKFPSMPAGMRRCGYMEFSPDDKWLIINDSHIDATRGAFLYSYDKAGFTFTAVDPDPLASVPYFLGPDQGCWHPSSTWVALGGGVTPYLKVFEGTASAESITEGLLTLNPVTLPSVCNSVYTLMDYEQVSGGVVPTLEASLDGGITWEPVTPGELVALGHTGNSLCLRVRFVRELPAAPDDKTRLYWVVAFATEV